MSVTPQRLPRSARRRYLGEVAETRYAQSGDATLAWTSLGDGPIDLLFVPGFISHIEHLWEDPGSRASSTAWRAFARADPDGPPRHRPVGPDRRRADARGRGRRHRRRARRGGQRARGAARLRRRRAATPSSSPPRTPSASARWCSTRRFARTGATTTCPGRATTRGARRRASRRVLEHWGTGARTRRLLAPSRAGDARLRAWLGAARAAGREPGPDAPRSCRALGDVDVRDAARRAARARRWSCTAPATASSTSRHSALPGRADPGRAARRAARAIDSLPSVGDTDALLGEIEEFLTGGRRGGRRARAADRPVHRHRRRHRAARRSSATAAGATCSPRTTRSSGASSTASAAARSRRSATAFLAVFAGAPSRAVRCARAIVARHGAARHRPCACGLHTGECELIGDDVGGMAVHIAARVSALAGAGRGARLGHDVRDRRRLGPALRGPRHARAARRARALAAVRVLCRRRSRRPQPRARMLRGSCRPRSATRCPALPRRSLESDRRGSSDRRTSASTCSPARSCWPCWSRAVRGRARARASRSTAAPATRRRNESQALHARDRDHRQHVDATAPASPTSPTTAAAPSTAAARGAGGTPADNEPCIRASNLSDGLRVRVRDRRRPRPAGSTSATAATTPSRSPRTRPAWPTGLNADRVDGQSAERDRQPTRRR